MLEPTTIILLGGLVTLILTWYAQKQQDKDNKADQTALKEQVASLNKQLTTRADEQAALQKELRERADEQVALQKELVKRADEQTVLQKELRLKDEEMLAFMSGGDGYCKVDFRFGFGDMETPALWIVNKGKLPLYNVHITVHKNPNNRPTSEELERDAVGVHLRISNEFIVNTREFNVTELTATNSIRLGRVPFNVNEKNYYTIHFDSRNGHWVQEYYIQPDGNGAIAAERYQIIQGTSQNGKVLEEFKSPGFR